MSRISNSDIVFVKYQDVLATKRFLSLSYAMFYGSDLSRKCVESFLNKKNVTQNEEVDYVLLGKKRCSDISAKVGNTGCDSCLFL